MQTQVEELADNKVRLTVEVPRHDVEHAVEHAASDLAESLKIPGFRKGKVPMPVLLARVGRERLYAEAVESHIGSWFMNAAANSRIHPVERPEYDYELPASPAEDWRFSATVAVQPKPQVPDWTKLEVPMPDVDVPADLIEHELNVLRSSVAELAPVERPAQEGDTLVVDLVRAGGEAQRDYVVELGAGRLVEELEHGLLGMSVGETREIAFERPGEEATTVEVTVKDVKEKILPPLDDDLARAATEFDTLDELRADLEQRLREQIEDEAEGVFRAGVVDALVDASGVEASGPLVESRARELTAGFLRSLERRGISPETYLAITNQTGEQLRDQLYAEARRSVGRELVLDAVAEQLGIEVSDGEVEAVVREQAQAVVDDPEATLREVRSAGTFERLREDLRLRSALDRVAAEVQRIPADVAAAREKLWTPEKEKPDTAAKLWTPGSKEPA